jgi:hypothetical protein
MYAVLMAVSEFTGRPSLTTEPGPPRVTPFEMEDITGMTDEQIGRNLRLWHFVEHGRRNILNWRCDPKDAGIFEYHYEPGIYIPPEPKILIKPTEEYNGAKYVSGWDNARLSSQRYKLRMALQSEPDGFLWEHRELMKLAGIKSYNSVGIYMRDFRQPRWGESVTLNHSIGGNSYWQIFFRPPAGTPEEAAYEKQWAEELASIREARLLLEPYAIPYDPENPDRKAS